MSGCGDRAVDPLNLAISEILVLQTAAREKVTLALRDSEEAVEFRRFQGREIFQRIGLNRGIREAVVGTPVTSGMLVQWSLCLLLQTASGH